jgi:hypothetical protein
MVSSFGVPKVADLVHQRLEPVVHLLLPFSFVDGKPSELLFVELYPCDLGDPVIFMCHLEGLLNLLVHL